jgi:hypothetical protein
LFHREPGADYLNLIASGIVIASNTRRASSRYFQIDMFTSPIGGANLQCSAARHAPVKTVPSVELELLYPKAKLSSRAAYAEKEDYHEYAFLSRDLHPAHRR